MHLRDRHDVRKTNGKGHLKVWEGWGAAVSDEMLSHGDDCIRHLTGSRNVKWGLLAGSGPDLGNERLSHHQHDSLATIQFDSGREHPSRDMSSSENGLL
eukprot:gene26237-biopygen15160